jgi:hypothetical protein
MSRRTRRRRAEASYGPETGTTYLLHFIVPATGDPARYRHAGHYIGWTTDLAARMEAHARGTGARLVEVITEAGLGFKLVRTWPNTTKDREDLLKHVGGGRRYCPECGVKPRGETGPLAPPRRLSLYELERAGTWPDGTPFPGNTPTWPLPAERREDAEMFGRQRRAAAREHAEREARAQAEADALFAEADRLDDLIRQPYGYRQQITAERAARIRAQLGEDLARDALAQASPEAAEARGRGPEFQGAERDAEIDRLAELFPDPEAQGAAAVPDYYRSPPGGAEHQDAYRQMFAAADGTGFAHPDPDLSYEIDNADELAAERYYEEQAERHYREPGEREAEAQRACTECGQAAGDWHDPDCRNDPALAGFSMLGPEPGEDAAWWVPGQERDEREMAGKLLSEHATHAEDAWRRERRATADERLAQLAHDEQALGWARQDAKMARAARDSATRGAYVAAADMQRSALGPELDDAGGRFPLPRVLDPSQASPVLAPVAATLPDGTPHADPLLAERGWQAQRGVYVRQAQPQAEAV